MQRNTVFEGSEEGSDVGKAVHPRGGFGRRVWQRVMETPRVGEVRLHVWKLAGQMEPTRCAGRRCRNGRECCEGRDTDRIISVWLLNNSWWLILG